MFNELHICPTPCNIKHNLKKVADLVGIGHASIAAHMPPNGPIRSDQARIALIHAASSSEAHHPLESCRLIPDKSINQSV